MRIKQRPEDFSVKESYRFDEVADGRYRVYLMDKQKLSTFDAVDRIRERFGLQPGRHLLLRPQGQAGPHRAAHRGGRRGRGHAGARPAPEVPGPHRQAALRRQHHLQPLLGHRARARRRTTSARSTSPPPRSNRLGVVNYFDSQRFGSLKHGQGFIAKDLIRGDFEAALQQLHGQALAAGPHRGREGEAVLEARTGATGTARVPFEGNKKYYRILKRAARRARATSCSAFLQIDSDYRALLLFTYQSYLWNEGVRRLLQLLLPREHLFPMPYQAGTLLFHRDADAGGAALPARRRRSRCSRPNSTFTDPKVQEAVEWVLGKEKLKLEDLRDRRGAAAALLQARGAARARRSRRSWCSAAPSATSSTAGSSKLNVAFTLPPGRLRHAGGQAALPLRVAGTTTTRSRRPRTPFGEVHPPSMPGRVRPTRWLQRAPAPSAEGSAHAGRSARRPTRAPRPLLPPGPRSPGSPPRIARHRS